ncbi:MAG: Lrp/AsnC family transcriptional regulator [Chitinophagales bacterium]|jgi:Lrp/AsnC family transcriptional regulator for asnA, asnC and gidA|nr:Lrp/AsnC family transcriptional regulator [Bacteroidota bacterium]MBP8248722.1 Lrp/AsnC family transcriptional regulator [Chitinophagales bacterium]MBK9506459.1 Lrp/AsnC family transcriptional regulator [Bacteroidota bacterium]MBK9557611.1 Lrp/AsnC family transcriptional regulator [Bacteroidota bacterium]MBL0280309.1 Lrp/AsnC family transcriptional regulator [Bacteroidota bacterium]
MSTMQLDDLDYKILEKLIKDGRKSFTDIADELNVSVGTIRNRFNVFVENELLTIIGRVNPDKIGFHTYAQILIKVRPVDKVTQVADNIANLPEVSFLAMTTGAYDLEVNVMCRDNEHLVQLMTNHITKMDGIFESATNIYFKVYKYAQPDLYLLK